MPPDPLGEILDLLGLGTNAKPPKGEGLPAPPAFTLREVVGEDGACWLELTGGDSVLRFTRTKAKLLCTLDGVLHDWAHARAPPRQHAGCRLEVSTSVKGRRLELRFKKWRAIRLDTD